MSSSKKPVCQATVLFRVDASLAIGSGHVMRCLMLADELTAAGAQCVFACRDLDGNLIEEVRAKGYIVQLLGAEPGKSDSSDADEGWPEPLHAAWLESSWREDAIDTCCVVKQYEPDWLIVDHYALDARWERSVATGSDCHVLAIDDLADRRHEVEMLLDQNFGRGSSDYDGLLSKDTTLLIGPEHALLRPEFAEHRERSLKRRRGEHGRLDIMISLGGVDRHNVSESVLLSLEYVSREIVRSVTVIMGKNAPWIESVAARASESCHAVEVAVNINDMASRLCNTDLVIGAAGSSAWERCCLGVPSVLITLADNQQAIASHLHAFGAAVALGQVEELPSRLPSALHSLQNEHALQSMSRRAAGITDGRGGERVLGRMFPAKV